MRGVVIMHERSGEDASARGASVGVRSGGDAALGPGREPTREHPRPSRVERADAALRVEHGGVVVAATVRGLRVLDASGASAYYFPPDDVKRVFLTRMRYATFCEGRGVASYWTLNVRGREAEAAAWSYDAPSRVYERLSGYIGFCASRVDACYVGEERVQPQRRECSGGWTTTKPPEPFEDGSGRDRR